MNDTIGIIITILIGLFLLPACVCMTKKQYEKHIRLHETIGYVNAQSEALKKENNKLNRMLKKEIIELNNKVAK